MYLFKKKPPQTIKPYQTQKTKPHGRLQPIAHTYPKEKKPKTNQKQNQKRSGQKKETVITVNFSPYPPTPSPFYPPKSIVNFYHILKLQCS